ncbi:Uncharacterised protein [Mycobacteroides abscessus subsp. abscessus]|nr:Uncharacterised protein [Mycobacteroides abscessus subsp. abscessus]
MTPVPTSRSTRRLTAGAERLTSSPISANVARALRINRVTIRSSVASSSAMGVLPSMIPRDSAIDCQISHLDAMNRTTPRNE